MRSPFQKLTFLLCSLVLILNGTRLYVHGASSRVEVKRVLVLGDSITYSGQYVAYLEAYARLHWPDRSFEFLNLGLPSETVSGLSEPGHAGGRFPRPDLHERLPRVLQQTKPDMVLACYGMNDGIYHPYDPQRFQAWQDGMTRLHEAVTALGADMIHVTPPVFDPWPIRDRTLPAGRDEYRQPYQNYNEVLDLYSTWLLAQRGRGWRVVDTHEPMNRFLQTRRKHDPDFILARDGVHLNDQGHWLIAREILPHFFQSPSDPLWRQDDPSTIWKRRFITGDYLAAIQKKQRLLSDAWLTSTGHQRPGMNRGLPLPTAAAQAQEIDQSLDTIIQQSRPNIVLVLADDLGYGDIQAYQPTSRIPTPHLNRLAAEGMRFTDAHSGSAVCTPTRYGILTGRYCWRTKLQSGVLGGYSPPLLEPKRSTLATLLKRRHYRTGAIGKWHLGMAMPLLDPDADVQKWEGDIGVDFAGVISDSPIHHGFDEYFGVSASLDMAPYVFIRQDRFTQLPTLQQKPVPFPHFIRSGPRAEDFVIEEVLDNLTKEAVSFIEKSANGSEPFFLYLPLTGPHKPTQPHPRFRGQTELGEYGDFVVQVDWSVGQILDALRRTQVDQNTLVLFTSDNGSYMYRFDDDRPDHVDRAAVQGFRAEHHRANGPWRGTKADIWEAGHRVPLLVRWPGRIQDASTCEQTVCLTDLYATFADIIGVPLGLDEAEDSVSLVGMLQGSRTPRGVPVVHHSVNGTFAVRDGGWKLVLSDGSGGRERPSGQPFQKPYHLFHLPTDPGETKNLTETESPIVERLSAWLKETRERGRSVEVP